MAKFTGPPPLDGLKRRIANHRQEREASGAAKDKNGMFVRQTFCLNRDEARAKAREWFDAFPKEGDRIEFTMRRLSSAD
jgi:hypothetical protein